MMIESGGDTVDRAFGGPHEGATIDQVISILNSLGEKPVHAVRHVAAAASITQSLELTQALLRLNPQDGSAAWLHCLVCELLFAAGRFEESLALAESLLATEPPESVTRSASVARILASAAPACGRTCGDGDGSAAEAAVRADLCFERGRLEEGLRWARSAAARAAEIPSPFWRVKLGLDLVDKLAEAGALAEAAATVEELDDPGNHPSEALALSALEVRALIHDGRWALAPLDLRSAPVSMALTSGERLFAPVLLDLLSIAAVHAGDLASARRLWGEADQQLKCSRSARPAVGHSWAQLLLAEAEYGPDAAHQVLLRLAGPDCNHLAALLARNPGAAAWSVRVARARGDLGLAELAAGTAETVAALNPGLPALAAAARHARSLLIGDSSGLAEAARVQPSSWARSTAAADLAATLSARVLEPVPLRGDPEAWARLSAREREVAALVSRGMTNGQIASRISCSAHTVNFHLRNIFRKLGIASRAEVAGYLPLSTGGSIR